MGLLTSILINEKSLIWTLDKRLEMFGIELNRDHRPALHS